MHPRAITLPLLVGIALIVGCRADDATMRIDSTSAAAAPQPSRAVDTSAASTQEPIAPNAPVFDRADLFDDAEEIVLAERLRILDRETSAQIAVTTVPTLGGEPIAPYATRYFNDVRLGERGVNNGLLIMLAPAEQEVRIVVGSGLEWEISDSTAALAVASMTDSLAANRFASAVTIALDRLEPLVRAVPWQIGYTSIADVRNAGRSALGQIAAVAGTLSNDHSQLTASGGSIHLRYPPHWNSATLTRPTATIFGRIMTLDPLTMQVLGAE